MSGENKIQAMLILEVLGRPPGHLKDTLQDLSKKIDSEEGVTVTNLKIHEPTELKNAKDLYTNFAEIEIEVDEIRRLAMIMFQYMPAHVEIISPENILINNNYLNEIFNELVRRLHGYDEVTRVMQTEKQILENQLKKLKESLPSKEKKNE